MNCIIQTGRLRLREFELTDAPFIVELLNSEGWLRFIGKSSVQTEEQAMNYLINGPIKSYRVNGYGLCLVERTEDEKAIGMCGIINRDNLDRPDIGFAFLPDFHGKGYAFEIATATLKYAKEHLKIPEVYAITIAENEKSIKLLERIGMKFIKTIFLSNDKEELLLFSSGVAVKDDLVSIKGLNIEQELTVRRLDREEEIPYSLLLIADDAVEAIDKYLPHSEVYVCEKREQMIAVYVLHTIDSTSAEIKNIAVSPEYQGYGIGTYLINNIIQDLSKKGFKSLLVGTGVTSERPIKLYRRLGFKDFKIIKDFFIDNYPQPIYEGGKRLRDMIVLKLDL